MPRFPKRLLIALAMLLFCAAPALGDTRALLVACSDFVTQPDLGREISGNLHMIGSALLGADPALAGLSIEDGTIGTLDALASAVSGAFSPSEEGDLSILYLCTHGVLSSADDSQSYLLLGNGAQENPLSSDDLYAMLAPIQGEKLLILDACFSGAMIGRGPGAAPDAQDASAFSSPFLQDTSMHVLTSASGREASWYYDSKGLQSGAVSYFASALSSGLGLYGTTEADANGDGQVTLGELHRHLCAAVPSSSSQLLSCRADSLVLPSARGAMLARPLAGFSFGNTLLTADDPTLDFSFTVMNETAVQYRLVEYEDGAWNWQEAQTFLDGEPLAPGRVSRSLTLPTVKETDSGYLMLQVFSVTGGDLRLCCERLIAVQPMMEAAQLDIIAPAHFDAPGVSEMPIAVTLGAPAQITVTVLDEDGSFVRRLALSQSTRPADGNLLRLYWDGRDANGKRVPSGVYTLRAESFVGFSRIKASAQLLVSGD